jgi:hypothetical protein
MKHFLVAIAIGCWSTASLITPVESDDPLTDKATAEKLEKWRVNVKWENGFDAKLALQDLTTKTKAVDPNHLGVKFTVVLPPDPNRPDTLGRHFIGKVNILLLDNPTISEVISYFCAQTNLTMKIRKNEVVFEMEGSDSVQKSK